MARRLVVSISRIADWNDDKLVIGTVQLSYHVYYVHLSRYTGGFFALTLFLSFAWPCVNTLDCDLLLGVPVLARG